MPYTIDENEQWNIPGTQLSINTGENIVLVIPMS